MENEFYKETLRDEFLKRQRKNSNYSLRAFSRDIGLPPAVLSEVFNGKRSVPKKSADIVADRLGLSPLVKSKFIQSILENKKQALIPKEISLEKYHLLNEERNYKIISEWEHYAVFSLIETKDFRFDENWISERLAISKFKVKSVLENLVNSGILEVNSNNQVVRKFEKLTTLQDVPSSALRRAHKEELDIAKEKLEVIGIEDRYFSSTTLAIDKDKLKEVKKIYKDFRLALTSLLDSGSKSEVYNFCFQAFPLTKLRNDDL